MSKNEEKITITAEELNGVSGGYLEDLPGMTEGWNIQCPYPDCGYAGVDTRANSSLKVVPNSKGQKAVQYTCSKCHRNFYVTAEGQIFTESQWLA